MTVDGMWIGLYAMVLLLVGFAAAGLITLRQPPHANRPQSASLAAALGFGLLPWLLLMLSIAGIKPSRNLILIIGAAAAALTAITLKRRPAARLSRSRLAWFAMPALALLLVQTIALYSLSQLPTHDYDAIAVWGFKAKILFLQPLSPVPGYFSDYSLAFTHLDYPLLLPMLWAGAFSMQGHTDEVLGRAVLVLPTLLIGTLTYSLTRPRLGLSIALLLTALSVGSFTTTRWAVQGLADQTLAMWIVAAAVALVRYIESRRTFDAMLAGALAAFGAMTKLEGTVLLAIVCLLLGSMVVWMPNRLRTLSGLLAALVIYAPWAIWARRLPHVYENYQQRIGPLEVLHHLDRAPELIREAWTNFYISIWWPILVLPLVALIAAAPALRRPSVICVWLILLAYLAADISAYLVTPWDLHELLPYTLDRLLLQLTPLAVLIAALHWESIQPRPPSSDPPSLDQP